MKKLCNFLLALLFVPLLGQSTKSLSDLALKYGSDKGPNDHNYTSTYEKYLSNIKDKPLKILEIGFAVGSSARIWDEYFTHPQTRLYFMDNNKDCYNYMQGLSARCSLHMIDQADSAQLLKFTGSIAQEFDIIIDDGGHMMHQQITSFKTLFPSLKKGGLYIVEDLHTSYWASYGSEGSYDHPKASQSSAIRFFQSLVDELNFIGARTGYANKNRCSQQSLAAFSSYQKEIASIHFYTSLCFIFKHE